MVVTALSYIGAGLLLLLVLAGFLLIYYARDYAAPVPPAAPGTVRVACIGDSITFGALVKHRKSACYPARLEKLLGGEYSVRNFGVNGHALQKSADLPYWRHPHFEASIGFQPDIVLIMLGTNDANEHNWKGTGPFIANYRELLEYYRALPSRPSICLMTPPAQFPVENYTRVIHEMRNKELDEISEAIRRLGEELAVGVIDINAATKNHPEFFKFDGIHPDAEGARFIAETAHRYLLAQIITA